MKSRSDNWRKSADLWQQVYQCRKQTWCANGHSFRLDQLINLRKANLMLPKWLQYAAGHGKREFKKLIGKTNMTVQTAIKRILEIDAGHRVYGHESKCANLHGHRYRFEFWVRPKSHLDKLGRVVDFNVVKEVVGAWLNENLDHAMILYKDDPLVAWFKAERVPAIVYTSEDDGELTLDETFVDSPFYGQKYYELSLNPTAENLCNVLAHKAQLMLYDYGIVVTKVGCWETPNCYAEYILQE